MLAGMSLLGGLFLGGAAYAVLGTRIDPQSPPKRASALAWVAMGFGITATLMVLSGLLLPAALSALGIQPVIAFALPAWLSIVFAFAGTVAAFGAFAKHDRHWPTWTGIVVGLLPVLFWVWFVIAEIVTPHG